MRHFGLFEGIGGFSLAARWMGWETVGWCEIDPFCQAVLRKNFSEVKAENQYGNIKETDFSKYRGAIDIVTGGFPCQPFSVAGKRKGKEDDRFLWPPTRRAYKEIKPACLVFENVAGLFTILEPESLSEVERKEIQLFSESEKYEINEVIERVQ